MNTKRLLFSLICAFYIFHLEIHGQETINSSGGEGTGGGGTISYSVGQLVINYESSSNGSISQGVQQPIELISLGIEEDILLIASAKVFPNPTTNKIQLRLELENLDNLSYQLYDINGKILQNNAITNFTLEVQLSHLPTSVYLLKIRRNGEQLKTFRIIKN